MTKRRELVPTGRPTVMTPEVVRKLEEAFSMDCTDQESCAYAGIGESTYYDHKKADEPFSERMERSKQFAFFLAKKTVINALKEDDGNLALKWLKNRQQSRYHEKIVEEQYLKEDPAAKLMDAVLGEVGETATAQG